MLSIGRWLGNKKLPQDATNEVEDHELVEQGRSTPPVTQNEERRLGDVRVRDRARSKMYYWANASILLAGVIKPTPTALWSVGIAMRTVPESRAIRQGQSKSQDAKTLPVA